MECLHARIPYSSWRLRVFRQLFLSLPNGTHPSRPLSTSREADSKDGSSKLDNSPFSSTPRLSELLPQSPFLNLPPGGLEKKRKKRPKPEDTKDLRNNPWAMALVSPPRMCAATGIRLPTAFLTKWGLVQRPGSEDLWLLPVDYMEDELATTTHAGTDTHPDADSKASRNNAKRKRPLALRLVDRLFAIRMITETFARVVSSKKSPALRLAPARWKYPLGPLTPREEDKIIWRQDMPDFLLGRARREVVESLKKASNQFKRSGREKGVWREVELDGDSEDAIVEGLRRLPSFERMGCGVVLILESGRPLSSSPEPAALNSSMFPDFVTLPQTKSKVPVLDLSVLLSEDDLNALREHHPRFRERMLFFRAEDRVTVDAIISLWRFKGSVMHDRQYLS